MESSTSSQIVAPDGHASPWPQPVAFAPPRESGRIVPWCLALIVLVTVVTDLVFFTGYYASDDKEYFFGAARVADSGSLSKQPLIGHTRLVMLAWNVVVGRLTNFNVNWMAGSYVLVHVALVLLTFVLARKIHDRWAGLIAAYTSAVFPLYSLFSTGLYPDLFIACGFVVAVLAFIKSFECRREGRNVAAAAFLFASGASIGFAYMSKETGLLALPFFFLAWLISEVRLAKSVRSTLATAPESARHLVPGTHGTRRRVITAILTGSFFATGFFAMFLLEHKTLIALTGNPDFFRLGWTEKEEDLDSIGNFHRDGGFRPDRRFLASLDRLGLEYWPTLLKVCFAAGLVIYPFTPRRNWVLYFFGIWIYGFLTWGTYSFTNYYPPRIQARYYIPAFPFLIIAFAASLSHLLQGNRWARNSPAARRRIGIVAAAFIALSPQLYMRGPNSLAGRLYRADVVANTRRAVQDSVASGSPIVVMSDRLAERVSPIWSDGPPLRVDGRRPAVVRTAREWRKADSAQPREPAEFDYIHTPPKKSEIAACLSFDRVGDLFHAASAGQFLVLHGRQAANLPAENECCYFASIDRREFGTIRRNGVDYRLSVKRKYNKMPRSRARQLWDQLAGNPVKMEAPALSVQVLRISPASVENTIESLLELMGRNVWPDRGIPPGVHPKPAALAWSVDPGPGESRRWVTGNLLEIPAERRFRVQLTAKLNRGESGTAQLHFHASSDRSSEVIRTVEMKLRDGVNATCFQTSEHPHFMSISWSLPARLTESELSAGLIQWSSSTPVSSLPASSQ